MALVELVLVDKVAQAIESGKFALGVFFDFSKAFDTVNLIFYYKSYMPMVLGVKLINGSLTT